MTIIIIKTIKMAFGWMIVLSVKLHSVQMHVAGKEAHTHLFKIFLDFLNCYT